ncbi:MAG: ABC transporter ATP-binding protein [Deltaproteobacteria bacterium]|nr:ABC transporter ATP-binding protein [Deltaproteobacteria bacterium]MBT4525466.1 ABC transporter ATP-binding protein [Deltaproteobacteria bacterium]
MAKIQTLNLNYTAQNNNNVSENILEDVNFTINKGEFIVLLGESGCGKSTLLNTLSGLQKPTSGQVLIDGENLKGPDSSISLIFQKSTLLPWLSVKENIAFGCKIRKDFENLDDRVAQYIEMIGLHNHRNSYPHELSVGMAKRVDIARALVGGPDILLLDEPFAPLDLYTRRKLQDELIYIWQESGMTCVFVTHNIESAIVLGQRIIIMSNNPGKIDSILDVPLEYPRRHSHQLFDKLKRKLLKKFGMAFHL